MSEWLPLGTGPLLVAPTDFARLSGAAYASDRLPFTGLQIIPCDAMEPGQILVLAKPLVFEPPKFSFESKMDDDLFRVRMYSRPMTMPSHVFLATIDDGWLTHKPRKHSRRQQKREVLRALFYRKHSQRKAKT